MTFIKNQSTKQKSSDNNERRRLRWLRCSAAALRMMATTRAGWPTCLCLSSISDATAHNTRARKQAPPRQSVSCWTRCLPTLQHRSRGRSVPPRFYFKNCASLLSSLSTSSPAIAMSLSLLSPPIVLTKSTASAAGRRIRLLGRTTQVVEAPLVAASRRSSSAAGGSNLISSPGCVVGGTSVQLLLSRGRFKHTSGIAPVAAAAMARTTPAAAFSTAATGATANSSTTTASTTNGSTDAQKQQSNNENNKKKGDSSSSSSSSNVFLDNLGTVFLTGVALLVATLTRSYMGSTNKNKFREQLEERATLDPLEIDDLRVANSELTLDVYRTIFRDLLRRQRFSTGTSSSLEPPKLTYEEFVEQVRATMKGLKGDAFTIELGHLIDRVVVSALVRDKASSNGGGSTADPQPLAFWMTVLSLALNAPIPDRIQALYEVLTTLRNGDGGGSGSSNDGGGSDSSETEKVTVADVRAMVGYLQDTCQLVPDSQIVALEHKKFPVQQYGRASAGELFEWDGPDSDLVDVDAFAGILRSRAVCVWGECYHKRKYV